jgi:SPP1 gp7 family putative phage head morphogenesis protein
MTVNEQLRDESVRHAVYLQRYSKAQLREVLAVLAKARDSLVAKIAATGGEWTKAYLERTLADTKAIYADAFAQMTGKVMAGARELAQYELDYTTTQLDDAVPVRISTTAPSPEQVWAAITTNPADRGHTLGELLDYYGRGEQARIVAAIRQGVVEGETVDQMIRRIRGKSVRAEVRRGGVSLRPGVYSGGVLDTTTANAEKIVRTAVMHVSNQAREETFRENSDLIKGVQWVATLDTRTCEECMALDGKTWDTDERRPEPPAHINCRCTTVPVVKSWREMGLNADELPAGTRASMNGEIPSTLSYGDWLRKQSRADVVDALGPSRAALFLKGGFDVSQFVDRSGQAYTLADLKAKDAEAFAEAGVA